MKTENKHIYIVRYELNHRCTHRLIDSLTYTHTEIQRHTNVYIHIHRKTDRQTDTHMHTQMNITCNTHTATHTTDNYIHTCTRATANVRIPTATHWVLDIFLPRSKTENKAVVNIFIWYDTLGMKKKTTLKMKWVYTL